MASIKTPGRIRGLSTLISRKPVHLGSLREARVYASSSTLNSAKEPSRKQVTIRSDDGRVQWNDLTVGEKAARTTQQTFNLGIILLGFGMTVGHTTQVNQRPLLILSRSELPTSCTLRCLLRIARLGTSTVQLIGSEVTDVR